MKIFLLTPIYATTTQGSGATPVVHYFAKEWVKQGHEVYVYNLRAKFPSIWYWVGRHFQHQLNTRLGMLVPTEKPNEEEFECDGVKITRICLKRFMPHSEASASQLERALQIICEGCKIYGVPDIFVGHWDNPQLTMLLKLKERFSKPVSLVLHENRFSLKEKYGEGVIQKLQQIDYIGFRNNSAKKDFESKYFVPKHSFIAYSGVSEAFVEAGRNYSVSFNQPISKFTFVGSLIERKHPLAIYDAIKLSDLEKFTITYIGDGKERDIISDKAKLCGDTNNVIFTGRIQRDDIIEYLKKSEVFVMISKGEIFGLVYLEAMALGLIPIGSRGEGIDGIIIDGENGFLCEAGNVNELSSIIQRIKKMSSGELQRISENAKKTAFDFTDSKVAEKYINSISQ